MNMNSKNPKWVFVIAAGVLAIVIGATMLSLRRSTNQTQQSLQKKPPVGTTTTPVPSKLEDQKQQVQSTKTSPAPQPATSLPDTTRPQPRPVGRS